ncbi:hypothetical protein [Methylobacterium sp. GC_Met_2]|uniref:hypothetical protein n=1 Tax=Methylobacterium sp. GC_Met_2 TaxID=2937376 RepID=UPI00226BBBC6|nr:hypothetical protein [Methylobacterium sp. GC_Met_2]
MAATTLDLLPLDNLAPAATGFDYEQLDDAAANEAKAVVERYRQRQKAYVIDTGRDLLAIKARLEHGLFLEWVQAELGMTPRSAQRAMSAAEVLGDKSDTVSYLPPTAIYALSAPSTPAPVRAAVLRRIEAGEAVRAENVMHEVREARDEARKRAATEKETARRAALTPEQRDEEDAFAAKGEKRRAALARKEERDRVKNLDERRANEAEARLGAAYLLDRLGADAVATFFARFDSSARYRIFGLVQQLANAERARCIEPVDVALRHFAMTNGFEWLSPEEQDRARDLAQKFEAGEPVDPVAVVDVGNGRSPRYEIVEGIDRYNALRGILGRETIPTRIAPPVAPEVVAAIRATGG